MPPIYLRRILLPIRCAVILLWTSADSILVLHSALLCVALCEALMGASLMPQTHSPPIIAPLEFIVCVTCRSSFTTALVRVSKAFNTQVLLYYPSDSHRDTWWYGDTSRVAIFNMAMFVFSPSPPFSVTCLSLPSQFTVQPSGVYTLRVCLAVAYTHTPRFTHIWARSKGTKGRKECLPARDWDCFGVFLLYVFSDNMEYCVLKGFLVVLLIQHCTSEGKVALCK